MPIPLIIPLIIGGVAAVVGGVAAKTVLGKDEKTNCITALIKAGVPPVEVAERCMGKPEPSLTEKLTSPLLIFAGIAIAGPPLINWMRESLAEVLKPKK